MENNPEINEQVAKLEKRVKVIETFLDNKYETFNEVQQTEKPLLTTVPKNNVSVKQETITKDDVYEPTVVDNFIEWCKIDWLMKLGAFLMLLALGWFVTYAFANNWIGPVGRISLGVLAGAGVMIAGYFAIPKKRDPGQVLVVLGGSMVLLTLYVARSYYDFFTPASALAMMSVVVVGMAIISVVHNVKHVATLALLGGAIVPVLVVSTEPNYLALLSYILVLNLGTILIASLRGWKSIITLALAITGSYSFVTFSGLEQQESIYLVWIFMALYFATFFVSNIAAILKTRITEEIDLVTTGMNGLLLLYWVYEFVPRESASLVLSGITLLLIGVSYFLLELKGLKKNFYVYSGLAVLFLLVATAFELKGEALIIAFSIEALALVGLSAYLLKDSKSIQTVSIVQFLPMFMAMKSVVSTNWIEAPLLNKDFFVILIVILSLVGTTVILKHAENKKEEGASLSTFYAIVAGAFAIALVWLSTHNIFDSVSVSRGIALVIYTIVGVSTLFYGTYLQRPTQRTVGGFLLGLVVLRLLFFDVWSMSLSSRIITFVVIGVLLISTAFFQKRLNK